MNKLRDELQDFLSVEPFVPFVVTTNSGFAFRVWDAKHALVGLYMLVASDKFGRLYHFPFTGIAHISEAP